VTGKYRFTGWSYKKTGTVIKKKFKVKEDQSLYPIYKAVVHNVTFHGNYGYIGKYMSSYNQTFTYGKEKKLNKNEFIRAGSTFLGWSTTKPKTMTEGNNYFYLDKGGDVYKNYVRSSEYGNREKYTHRKVKNQHLYAVWKQNEYYLAYKSQGREGANEEVKAGQIFTPIKGPTEPKGFFLWNTKSSGKGRDYYSGEKDRVPLVKSVLYAQFNKTWTLKSKVNNDRIEFTKYKDGSCYAEFFVYNKVTTHVDGFLITDSFRELVDNPKKEKYGLSKSKIQYFADVKEVFDSYYKNGKIFSSIPVGSDEYYALLLHIMKAGEDSIIFWVDIFTDAAVVWSIISAAVNAKKPISSINTQGGGKSVDNILSNKSFTNQTGKVSNYVSNVKGDTAVRNDFNALKLKNVKTYSNGATVGYLSDGRTVNIHPSSSLGGMPTLEIYNPATGKRIKIRY
jgi:hypothetical protein